MQNRGLIRPYGGKLIDLVVDNDRENAIKETALHLPEMILSDRQICDLELLASGGFSPLASFMTRDDYESVLDRMRLSDGTLWPLPVCLDIPEDMARSVRVGEDLCLRDQEGFLLAVIHVKDMWPVDRKHEAMKIFNTLDTRHPGVEYLLNEAGDYYIGGSLEVVRLPLHFDFRQFRRTPAEVRQTALKEGWHRVVGFQTENPVHRLQFEMTIRAMQEARANLLLLPVVGTTKPGDFDHYTRVRCYKKILPYYPSGTVMLNMLPLAMRMAGPREAVFHAIIARNYGCSHFIVGRHHADPCYDGQDGMFYKNNAAKELVLRYSEEIGVEIVPFEEMGYIPDEDRYVPSDQVSESCRTLTISGSDIRERIRTGRRIPEWASFPEVIEEISRTYPGPKKQGFTIFFTGLSGSGKSTLAKVLYSRFMEIGTRPVTLLDGDIVRQNLSKELNFSKEHRDLNILRIGFVASEITKNRGIAICAPIAPYAATRARVRRMIENYGGFIEVHVATPIEECERRDRKGMYAKARAGLIKGFTGVDDPYEAPERPDVRIDTTGITPEEGVQEILLVLAQKGFV
ncbi:MAG: bifunctional sulfate adenylyltransferase/adenylylsulfate kinase [Deltaproteobacteria bacterium]|nr:bifunctional sulfate adenylyltransferase/adenylylsulfate kinase [Deltaproteobacteria bacterium]